jgi:transposase
MPPRGVTPMRRRRVEPAQFAGATAPVAATRASVQSSGERAPGLQAGRQRPTPGGVTGDTRVDWFRTFIAPENREGRGVRTLHHRPARSGRTTLNCVLLDTSASVLGREALAHARAAVLGIARAAYLAREQLAILAFGNDRVEWLLSPRRVKPFIPGGKNDAKDAEGIAVATGQANVPSVAVKTLEQQDIQSLHRVRELHKRQRTAVVNQARSLLAEYGVVLPRRVAVFRRRVPELLEDAENGLTDRIRSLVAELLAHFKALDAQVKAYQREMEALSRALEPCRRLEAIPGIGSQTATALYAYVGRAEAFRHGRQMAASLGLVPSQHSSGETRRLGRISKRGDRYLRTVLIHGARSMVYQADRLGGWRGQWLRGVIARQGPNKAAVALANKNARIAWALLASGREYEPA